MSHAAGVIIFDNNEVLLVETKRQGNWGFPKGGHEKGERPHQTAIRELKEETNVCDFQINLLPFYEYNVIEKSAKGNIGVQYGIATLTVDRNELNLVPMDSNEVFQIGWKSFKEARELLCRKRKEVLKEAHMKYQSSISCE